MQQTTIGISWFGLIFIGLIVIAVGLAALKLLSLLVNALMGRRKSPQPAKVGTWSGVLTAMIVSATVLVGLLAVGVLGYRRVQSMAHAGAVNAQAQEIEPSLDQVAEERARQLAEAVEQEQADVVNSSVTTTDMNVHPTEEQAAVLEARKAQLQQLVSSIGQFVRSNLEMVGDKQSATIFGQAAKSDNGDVVVFQLSDEMVQQILGTAGQDLLKSFNSQLPGRIRQTYALIPLTPPVGSTVPVKPLLAAGGLEMIANSIVSFVEHAESAMPAAAEYTALPAEAEGSLAVAPQIRPIPDWVSKTDGRRIVVHTKPILAGDDAETPMTVAINEALAKHVQTVTAAMNTALQVQAKSVRMELSQATAKKYVVDTYERLETMNTATEGPKPFRILYALVEFPEAVDQMAVRQIRQSVQQDRIMGLGVVVGLTWLSVCSAGFGIRQWRKGTVLRRVTAAPVFAVISIPTLLVAVGLVFALAKGEVPRGPWSSQQVTVDLVHSQLPERPEISKR